MIRECCLLWRIRFRKSCVIMSSITLGSCLSAYIFVFIVSVGSNAISRDDVFSDTDVRYIGRHHNRNLQNSPVQDDVASVRLGPDTSAERSSKYESTEPLYLDDEDVFKKKSKQRVRTADNKNKTSHLPQVLIIGVKKAGTRALLEYLRMHPKVKAPGPEPHFFDKHYKNGLDWYRNQMPETKKGQITMEKTPSYFVTKGIPERVYKMSKKTKLIIVFRDPVTRAISDYAQLVSRNPNVKTFEELVFVNNQTKIIDTSWAIVKIGVYAQHLARWLDYFPVRQMHFVSGENLIKDPAAELKRIQEFLGVEQYITENNFTFNHTKGFPCYRKDTQTQKWHCLNEEKGRQHPVIDPSVTRRLQDFYRPFNIKLYSMTGQNYGWT